MVIEKNTHKFHVCRNGVRELLNLERFFFLFEYVHDKTNKIMTQNKEVTFVFKAFI